MKHWILATLLCLGTMTTVVAQSKADRRVAYTLRNLKLDKKTQSQLEPLLRQYLKEKKAATKEYDDLKDKYKAAEKAGTLTDSQAKQLLDAKFKADAAELQVKIRWRAEFAKVVKARQVWYVFDYIGDKMSKVDGKNKDDDD